MLEPLFKILYPSFNLLQYFKDGAHRSKFDNILVSDPDSIKASGSDLSCFGVRIMLPIFTHFLPNQILLLIIIILSVSDIKQLKKYKVKCSLAEGKI